MLFFVSGYQVAIHSATDYISIKIR